MMSLFVRCIVISVHLAVKFFLLVGTRLLSGMMGKVKKQVCSLCKFYTLKNGRFPHALKTLINQSVAIFVWCPVSNEQHSLTLTHEHSTRLLLPRELKIHRVKDQIF